MELDFPTFQLVAYQYGDLLCLPYNMFIYTFKISKLSSDTVSQKKEAKNTSLVSKHC
jgi:hypothetical protein